MSSTLVKGTVEICFGTAGPSDAEVVWGPPLCSSYSYDNKPISSKPATTTPSFRDRQTVRSPILYVYQPRTRHCLRSQTRSRCLNIAHCCKVLHHMAFHPKGFCSMPNRIANLPSENISVDKNPRRRNWYNCYSSLGLLPTGIGDPDSCTAPQHRTSP